MRLGIAPNPTKPILRLSDMSFLSKGGGVLARVRRHEGELRERENRAFQTLVLSQTACAFVNSRRPKCDSSRP